MNILKLGYIENQIFIIITYYCFFPFIYWLAAHLFHSREGLNFNSLKRYKEKKRIEIELSTFLKNQPSLYKEKIRTIEDIGERKIDNIIFIFPLIFSIFCTIIQIYSSDFYSFKPFCFIITTLTNIIIVFFLRERESISFAVYSGINSAVCFTIITYLNPMNFDLTPPTVSNIFAFVTFLTVFTYGGLTLFSTRIDNAVNEDKKDALCSGGGYTEVYTIELGNREKHVLTQLFSLIAALIICVSIYGFYEIAL